MTELIQTVGWRLKVARRKQELTQEQLANILLVSENTVNNWENDKAIPKPYIRAELAKILEIDKEEFENWIKENPVIEKNMDCLYRVGRLGGLDDCIDIPRLSSRYHFLNQFPRNCKWLPVDNLYGTDTTENIYTPSKGTALARALMLKVYLARYEQLMRADTTKNIITGKTGSDVYRKFLLDSCKIGLKNGFYENGCIEFSEEEGIRLTKTGKNFIKQCENISRIEKLSL